MAKRNARKGDGGERAGAKNLPAVDECGGGTVGWAMPQDSAALHAWLREVAQLRVPTVALIPGHSAPFDYLTHVFFEGSGTGIGSGESGVGTRTSVLSPQSLELREENSALAHQSSGGGVLDCVVWANRGGGKTFLGAVATMLDLVFKPGIEVRILGGSMDQSKRMHVHLRRLFERPALAGMVSGRTTDRRLRLTNGSEVELLAQSQVSVRGTRVQKLRCDEVELFDSDVWEAAQLTTRSKTVRLADGREWVVRGSVECLSTMHLPFGIMHRVVEEATAGKRRLFKWGVVDVLDECGAERECRGKTGDEETEIRRDEVREGNHEGVHGEAGAGSSSGTSSLRLLVSSPLSPDCPLLGECAGRAKERAAEQCGHVGIDDAIRMKGRVARATWESEMLSLRPRRTDAVLPEFDVGVHVGEGEWGVANGEWDGKSRESGVGNRESATDLPDSRLPISDSRSSLWIGGMDFGFRAPTVFLWGVVDAGGVLRIVDERVEAGATLDEHIAAIRARGKDMGWPELEWIGVDPAGNQADMQTGMTDVGVLRRAGFVVRDRRLTVREGLEAVRARLRPAGAGAAPTLFVHARCVKLIESMTRYHYDPDDLENDKPVKDGFDHAADALRYMVQNLDRAVRVKVGRYA